LEDYDEIDKMEVESLKRVSDSHDRYNLKHECRNAKNVLTDIAVTKK